MSFWYSRVRAVERDLGRAAQRFQCALRWRLPPRGSVGELDPSVSTCVPGRQECHLGTANFLLLGFLFAGFEAFNFTVIQNFNFKVLRIVMTFSISSGLLTPSGRDLLISL